MRQNNNGKPQRGSDHRPAVGVPPKDLSPQKLVTGGYLRLESILAPGVFPVSRTTWYELISIGYAPAPLKIGTGSFWRVEDIEAFLARDPAELSRGLVLIGAARSKPATPSATEGGL